MFLPSRNCWSVNVPKHLSNTGKRRQLFFETKGQATAVAEQLKCRKDNFGSSLASMSRDRIALASKAFEILIRSILTYWMPCAHSRRCTKLGTPALPSWPSSKHYPWREARPQRALFAAIANTRDRMPEFTNGLSRTSPLATSRQSSYRLDGRTQCSHEISRGRTSLRIKRGYLSENPIDRLDFVHAHGSRSSPFRLLKFPRC